MVFAIAAVPTLEFQQLSVLSCFSFTFLLLHLPSPLVLKDGRYLNGAAELVQEQRREEMRKLLGFRAGVGWGAGEGGPERTFSEELEDRV